MFEVKVLIPGLEELAVAINNLAGSKEVSTPKKVTKTKEKEQEQVNPVEEVNEEPVEEEIPRADGEVVYSLEQVRAKMTVLCRAGKQKEVKALLTSLGADDLKSLDPSKYSEAMEKAGEL